MSESKRMKTVVRFSEEPPKVHQMIVWSFAYKQARKGNWVRDALDRFRFQQRIKDCEHILSRIFTSEHRMLHNLNRGRFES